MLAFVLGFAVVGLGTTIGTARGAAAASVMETVTSEQAPIQFFAGWSS
jgi:hypothetical protein